MIGGRLWSSYLRWFKKRFRPSVPSFTSFLCIVSIVVTVASTVSISELYAMRGSDLLAKSAATAMASAAHQKVDSFMNSAYSDADSLQFMILMSERKLPTDGIRSGRFNIYSWSDEYLTTCAMSLRGADFLYSYISFSFDDGSAAICQRGAEKDTFETVSSTIVPGSADTTLSITSTYSLDGIFLQRSVSNESYDARNRSWYSVVPQDIMSKKWFPVGFVGLTPAASLVATMANTTNQYLGAISVSFSIERISALLTQAKPVISSDIILLDEKMHVVGSTRSDPTSVSRAVRNEYVLTEREEAEGCVLSDTGSETDYALLTCHRSIKTYGYRPLLDVYTHHRDVLLDIDDEVNTERVSVDNSYYYVSVMGLSYSSLNAWRIVCFINEEDITQSVRDGRVIVIWVSVAIVVLVAIVSGTLASLLLRPLSRVAKLMATSAYLSSGHRSDGDSESDDGDGSLGTSDSEDVALEPAEVDGGSEKSAALRRRQQRRQKAELAQKELLKERTLSFWGDVRSIQQAYWAMADQLGELQGYIPEHVRDGIVEFQKQKPVMDTTVGGGSGGGAIVPDSPSLGAPKGDVGAMENLRLVGSSPYLSGAKSGGVQQGDQVAMPRLDYEALQIATAAISGAVGGDGMALSLGEPRAVGDTDGFTAIVPQDVPTAAPIPSAAILSTRGELETMDGESFDDVSVAAARLAYGTMDANGFPIPIIFGDNVLVDRDITVVHLNILQFHMYAQATHGRTITEEHEVIVNYIYNAARRCGGNLENFIGDKFWISFNATSKCLDGQIAAACLAIEVTSLMNRDALEGQHRRRINHERRVQNLPPLPRDAMPRHRFRAAPFGVSCGISTGRAFVGPLGTKSIKRHSILSNTFTEASALERLSLRYPGCSVMIGGDMIPAIEGYFQYLIMDASLLPGSGGKRRRIASLKGPMLAHGRNSMLHRGGLRKEMPFRADNPFKGINDCFNAFLEGRTDDCARTLREVDEQTTAVAKELASAPPAEAVPQAGAAKEGRLDARHGRPISKPVVEDGGDGDTNSSTTHFNTMSIVSSDAEEQCAEISLMSRLLWSILTAPSPVDGRLYRSPFGEMYMPVTHALRLVVKDPLPPPVVVSPHPEPPPERVSPPCTPPPDCTGPPPLDARGRSYSPPVAACGGGVPLVDEDDESCLR